MEKMEVVLSPTQAMILQYSYLAMIFERDIIERHHGENAYITHLAVDVGEMPRVQSHICQKFVL